jgi:hypothetical protein
LTTIEELEERVKKLEDRILVHDETIRRTLDFVQRAIDAQFKQWKEDQEQFKKHSVERMDKIMKELGYKI